MKKERTGLNFSRFLRLCGYAETAGKESNLSNQVIPYLNRSFLETKTRFEAILEKAIKEVQGWPLGVYRQPAELRAAWDLTGIRLPLPVAENFLTATDPEKSGVICQNSDGDLAILSSENLKLLDRLSEKVDKEKKKDFFELHFSLHWWQEAVRCVWAGIILNQLVYKLQGKGVLLLPGIVEQGKNEFFQSETISLDEPIGQLLCFGYINDAQADEFCELYERSLFGSRFCETAAGDSFKEWLRKIDVGILRQNGLSFAQADTLLMAGSQRIPDLDIELIWNQQAQTYHFGCRIKNKDVHGFDDPSRTAYIPGKILFEFLRGENTKTQENLLRLLIRGGWRKVRDLAYPAIKNHFD